MNGNDKQPDQPVAAQEAVAYWRVTFRMYHDDAELCVLDVAGDDRPTLDSINVTPRPHEIISAEPPFIKQHRWDQYGERCLDCGDKDWMNDPVCRQRLADPSIEATPSIAVNPSAEVTPMSEAAPVAAAPVVDALRRIKLRLHFLDMPGEPMWNTHGDCWAPDWRYEIQLIEHVLHGRSITAAEKPTDTRKRIELASTPAAPGIDVDALAQEIRRVDGNHSLGAGALAEALVEWLSRHVIDASPKGGSTDAKDAARYRWLRDSSGNAASDTPSTIVMADEGGWDFVFGPDLDKATDAAMQATSAEVGS